MATKMKKLYKKLKFISRIFGVSVKAEKKMEIGYPTDVKHVTHIGLDTPSDTLSNWENEFKMSATDFSTESSNHNSRGSNFTLSTWSSQDFEQSMECDLHSSDLPNSTNPKKHKHKRFTSKSSTTSKTNKVHVLNSADQV